MTVGLMIFSQIVTNCNCQKRNGLVHSNASRFSLTRNLKSRLPYLSSLKSYLAIPSVPHLHDFIWILWLRSFIYLSTLYSVDFYRLATYARLYYLDIMHNEETFTSTSTDGKRIFSHTKSVNVCFSHATLDCRA